MRRRRDHRHRVAQRGGRAGRQGRGGALEGLDVAEEPVRLAIDAGREPKLGGFDRAAATTAAATAATAMTMTVAVAMTMTLALVAVLSVLAATVVVVTLVVVAFVVALAAPGGSHHRAPDGRAADRRGRKSEAPQARDHDVGAGGILHGAGHRA